MLVDNQEKNKLPKIENNLQDEFSKFFLEKIGKIHTWFDNLHFYEPPLGIKHFSMNFMK